MYTALYRVFRPEIFNDILGQEHIVKILKNQLAQETTSHAYLFCGTRGTGKTSTARILAKGLNCLSTVEKPCGKCENCKSIQEGLFLDVIEIDAASNNGVDNIRELRESVKYAPVTGKYKVYIIDEVHMLSTGAFNALLKTLEEPPERVLFILATTEPQKLPATILSRCLRLDFRRVPETILKQSLRDICEKKGIKISSAALGIIAANADGSVRDGLSLLDQCISSGIDSVAREDVLDILGTSGEDVFIEITDCVLDEDIPKALLLINKIFSDGKDARQFMRDWVVHFRGLLITKYIKNPEDILNMSWENVERIRLQSEKAGVEAIKDCIVELSKTSADAKWSNQPGILLELAIVKMAGGFSHVIPMQVDSYSMPVEKQRQPSNKLPEIKEKKAKVVGKTKIISDDMEKIWQRLFEEAETGKASFNLLRTATSLVEVGENVFSVQANNELMKMYLKENKVEIESLMSRLLDKSLKMEVQSISGEGEKTDLVDEISNKLGLNIEIE